MEAGSPGVKTNSGIDTLCPRGVCIGSLRGVDTITRALGVRLDSVGVAEDTDCIGVMTGGGRGAREGGDNANIILYHTMSCPVKPALGLDMNRMFFTYSWACKKGHRNRHIR